jgi:hypothetical protein
MGFTLRGDTTDIRTLEMTFENIKITIIVDGKGINESHDKEKNLVLLHGIIVIFISDQYCLIQHIQINSIFQIDFQSFGWMK